MKDPMALCDCWSNLFSVNKPQFLFFPALFFSWCNKCENVVLRLFSFSLYEVARNITTIIGFFSSHVKMMKNFVGEIGENLVGRKIEVWWPEDKQFYAGVVQSFDPVNKKHKVVYEDEDEEVLVLSDEKWHLVNDEEEAIDLQSPSAPETSRKKKVKTSSDSPTKQSKADTKGKGASSSKSKGRTPGKSGGKPNDDSKPGAKSIDETPRTASKSKGGSGKSKGTSKPSKSKDDSPKTGGKSKDGEDTPKTVAKLKDNKMKAGSSSKSPKAGTKTKANANGASAKGKSSASKVEESEEPKKGSVKGRKRESEDSAKGKGLDSGDSKSGKKRRKGAT